MTKYLNFSYKLLAVCHTHFTKKWLDVCHISAILCHLQEVQNRNRCVNNVLHLSTCKANIWISAK